MLNAFNLALPQAILRQKWERAEKTTPFPSKKNAVVLAIRRTW